MKNLKAQVNKKCISVFLLMIIAFSCHKRTVNQFPHFITSDSIQYYKSITNSNSENVSILSFDIQGKNERYYYSDDELYMYPYFEKPRLEDYGVSNNWRMLNDSTIQIMGISNWIVRRYNQDSIFLVNLKNKNIIRTLVRLKTKPKVNLKSIEIRDSLQMKILKEPKIEITESNN